MVRTFAFGGERVEQVLGFAEALEAVLSEARQVRTLGVERVKLLDALGRVLAEDVRADRDQPPFDRSTRDGFALKAADAASALRVMGQVRAGEMWSGPELGESEALEIMTGAPLPAGTDCVVMVEHIEAADGFVRLAEGRGIRAGENVVPQGVEAREGDIVLSAGNLVGAPQVAVAASLGYAELAVHARPKVALIATGDELVDVGEQPEAWQIRNSNSYALKALVQEEGGYGGKLEIARDERLELFERVAQGNMWDLMVLSGGVSMGRYDLVEEVLMEFGAEFFFTGALIQPGKPVVFGRIPKRGMYETDDEGRPFVPKDGPWNGEWTYFFGLPGNPVSTQVTFRLFVAPMLRALAGRRDIEPVFAEARLADDVKGGAKVTRFLPAELNGGWDGVMVRPVAWQGSGDLAANARANAYVVLPLGVEHFPAGTSVRVLLR